MGALCGGHSRDTLDRFSDRCLHLFPCLSDPARRSTFCLRIALVMLHLIYVGVLFVFDKDLIHKTKEEPWYTTVYLILFAATLAQYFITSGSSPGYVIDAMRAVNEADASNNRASMTSKQPASSKNGDVAITIDRNQLGHNLLGHGTMAWTKLVMDMYPTGTSLRSVTCSYCDVVQPPRAKHCHDCDKCVLQFDHHCVWLGTCIGQGNHCPFWWYICGETALSLWTGTLYIQFLKSDISKPWWLYVIMILLLVTLFFCLIFHDSSAQKCLSQINITEEQSTQSMISIILKSLSNLSDLEVSALREELLKKFSPDDSDSLGTQFFTDAQQRAKQSNSVDLASIFDDDGPNLFHTSSEQNEQSAKEMPNLLSVNQLLESVLETAQQVGRISVSTEPEFSYKEMTHHCETLLTGKQQKMYNLMNSQHRQDNTLIEMSENSSEQDEESTSDNQVDNQVENQLADQKVADVSDKPTHETVPSHCKAEYQSNPESFRLPASSPYDNFLKAARW